MKTSLEFITMELEYKRIMVTLKSTELEKLKVRKDELESRYKCEIKLRNELFDLLFSGSKTLNEVSIGEEREITSEEIREKREERGGNRVEIREKGEISREERIEKIEEIWKNREEIGRNSAEVRGRREEKLGNRGESIDSIWIEGYEEEENWEFEGSRLPMDNVAITQLKLNRDLAILKYYSMKASIENMKGDIEILRKVLIYYKGEIKGVKGNKKGYKWLN